jgi:hypothetical protein
MSIKKCSIILMLRMTSDTFSQRLKMDSVGNCSYGARSMYFHFLQSYNPYGADHKTFILVIS